MTNIYDFVSIATASRDVKQNITADTITVNNLTIKQNFEVVDFITDNIFTDSINANAPATEININNNLLLNGNDITGIGTLEATNIIGNIADDIIDVNQINPKDFSFISITGDLTLNNNDLLLNDNIQLNSLSNNSNSYILSNNDFIINDQLKIRDNGTNTITSGVDLEIESNGSVYLYLDGDRDNTGADTSNIVMSVDGNNRAGQIQLRQDNNVQFICADSFDPVAGTFLFSTGLINNGGSTTALPSIGSLTDHFRMNFNGNTSYRNLLLNNNNVTGVNTIDASLVTTDSLRFLTVPNNDDTENRILVLNTADNVIEYRNASSLPSSNPFNQNLNTTDSPTFNNITINGNEDLTQGALNNVLSVVNSTNNITVSPSSFLIMDTQKSIALNDGFLSISNPLGTTPPAPGGFQLYLFKNGSYLGYRNGSYTYRINPFYSYAESLTFSTTTSTTFQTKVSLVTSVPDTTIYKVGFSAIWGNETKDAETELQLTLAGTPINTISINNPTYKSNGEYGCNTMTWHVNLTAGSNTFLLQYRSVTGATTAAIQDAKVWVQSI